MLPIANRDFGFTSLHLLTTALARLGPQGDWLYVGSWQNQTSGGGTFTPTSSAPCHFNSERGRNLADADSMPDPPLMKCHPRPLEARIRFRVFVREIIVRNVICSYRV